MELTQSMQDYLKFIYELERAEGRATTSRLAELMGVADASTTNMVKRLADLNLVQREPYRGVVLSPAGEKVALEVIRHHRLLEAYLATALGYSWEEVHAEAERMEHAISEDFEDRIDRLLGYPTVDAHGSPIPTKAGDIAKQDFPRLSELQENEVAAVRRVSDRDPEMLAYLTRIGVGLGAEVRVAGRATDGGPITIEVGPERHAERHVIGQELGRNIFVEPIKTDAS